MKFLKCVANLMVLNVFTYFSSVTQKLGKPERNTSKVINNDEKIGFSFPTINKFKLFLLSLVLSHSKPALVDGLMLLGINIMF